MGCLAWPVTALCPVAALSLAACLLRSSTAVVLDVGVKNGLSAVLWKPVTAGLLLTPPGSF